ncbi:iron-containing alcohol dehydrogenase [Sediminicoccus sp. KRV36]|uniref:iron-containing alcohol dehydrogenase n=1 Tax=Sediminicoccus sp. KRV36 TaxID=3133721 RepID=UPI00200BB4A0|nr:iron-containing alcohol dehydrogenase [Sediminicoccus rosea]UPY39324.1 iron-containing alcohol dehydrogenase [Sediminicoccus rosea]
MVLLNRIQFAHGAISEAAGELALAGISRPLVITDAGVVAAGLWEMLRSALPAALPLAVFAEVPPNPTEAAVHAAVAAYHSHGADGVLALGGGSPMDLAKAVALLATHDGETLTQYSVIEGGLARITARAAPVVAVPTTSGTGSEVSRGALIVMADGRKLSIGSPHLIPRAAICDPDLTLGLPPRLTAGTGMDALAHGVETLCSPRENPIADAIARDGLRRAWLHLPTAVADGSDHAARHQMMLASVEVALAFQKGLGAVHALSHPLGGLAVSPHHGTLNALLLPHVLRFNAPSIGAVLPVLGEAMGLQDHRAEAIADAIAAMSERIGLPARLSALGVTPADLPPLAAAAMRDHHHLTNPRRTSEVEYLGMLQAAF